MEVVDLDILKKVWEEEDPLEVELIQATPNPIETIAKIASVCYGHETARDPVKLFKHLYLNGHHSVFEHIYYTFHISGISRACSHQLVRHRLAAITQRSQRYCDESNDTEWKVTPHDIGADDESVQEYQRIMDKIQEAYKDLMLLHNIPKEDARYVLPNACSTELYFSCNLRELIHIANERLCARAQWEIREVVEAMRDCIKDEEIRDILVPKCRSGIYICNNNKCPMRTHTNKM